MPVVYNIFSKKSKSKTIKQEKCVVYKLTEEEINKRYGNIKSENEKKLSSCSYCNQINKKYKSMKNKMGKGITEYWNIPEKRNYM